MAIPVIESISEDISLNNGSETATISQPTGITTGDWCFTIVSVELNNLDVSPWDDVTNKPTGFDLVQIFGEGGNTDMWAAVYSREITGAESWPISVAWDGATVVTDFCAITLRVSGVDSTTPVDIIGTPQFFVATTSHVVSSVTTTSADCLAISALAFDGADGSPIAVSGTGWTGAAENVVDTGALGTVLSVATKEQATAGIVGDCTFTSTVSDGAAGLMLAIKGAASTQTITDVDTDETIVDAQQDVSVTVSGFSFDVTSAELQGGGGNLELEILGSGTSYTFDTPNISSFAVNTGGVPFTSSNHVVSILVWDEINSEEEASLGITFNPQSGWAVVDVASGSIAAGSIFEDRSGGAPADTSQIYYPTASNTSITAAGIISTDLTTVSGQLFNVSTVQWEPWTWTTGITASNGLSFSKFILSLEGYIGSIADRAMQYLTDQGFATGSLTDRKMAWLGSLGYTGSLNDRLTQWKNS